MDGWRGLRYATKVSAGPVVVIRLGRAGTSWYGRVGDVAAGGGRVRARTSSARCRGTPVAEGGWRERPIEFRGVQREVEVVIWSSSPWCEWPVINPHSNDQSSGLCILYSKEIKVRRLDVGSFVRVSAERGG